VAAAAPTRLSRRVVALLAITAGAAVANLYYIQPLLNLVGDAFGVSDGTAGILVTCAQVGYFAGLGFLVPVGDLVERRRLIVTLLLGAAAASAACAAAPTFAALAAALVAIGVLSVVAQIVVPLSSTLAAPQERGQVVGTVVSGLVIGILSARVFSGVIAALGGWRLVYALGAAAMVALALVVRRSLPLAPPTDSVPYAAALRSVLRLIADEPVLRQRMALGALAMAGFTVLWTSIAFLLHSHYGYGTGVIGLFGLAGIAGALAAPLAGRWADRGHGALVFTLFLAAMAASWGLLALGRSSIVALVAGIVLLDLGVQGAQVSNQAVIYRLRPDARSRLTTAYMVAFYFGGVVGSLLSATVYEAAGWGATCGLGAAIAVAALVVWTATRRRTAIG
jgi:predicted MFS family arabinose efflux permease